MVLDPIPQSLPVHFFWVSTPAPHLSLFLSFHVHTHRCVGILPPKSRHCENGGKWGGGGGGARSERLRSSCHGWVDFLEWRQQKRFSTRSTDCQVFPFSYVTHLKEWCRTHVTFLSHTRENVTYIYVCAVRENILEMYVHQHVCVCCTGNYIRNVCTPT